MVSGKTWNEPVRMASMRASPTSEACGGSHIGGDWSVVEEGFEEGFADATVGSGDQDNLVFDFETHDV
jgi:hypothetical protein